MRGCSLVFSATFRHNFPPAISILVVCGVGVFFPPVDFVINQSLWWKKKKKKEKKTRTYPTRFCKNVATNRTGRKLFRACADIPSFVGKQLVYHQTDDEQLSGLSVTHDC